MAELFVFGTFWFWVLVVVEIVGLTICVEYETGIGATICALAFAGLLQFGGIDLYGFAVGNPWKLLIIVSAYFSFGAIWGIVKWWLFCSNRLNICLEYKPTYYASKKWDSSYEMSKEEQVAFFEKVASEHDWKYRKYEYGSYTYESIPPKVTENKAKIISWMTFWFVSMAWTLAHDFVKGMFKQIYAKMAAFLQHISDSIFRKSGL